jgi:hypothetical protein
LNVFNITPAKVWTQTAIRAILNMFKSLAFGRRPVMSVVLAYLIYLAVSVGVTVAAGRVLARGGRAFLREAYGGDGFQADAVSRLLVAGFYLLGLGFIALTAGMPGSIGSLSHGLRLLSVKIGQLLLVLGAEYFACLFAFGRLRRARSRPSAVMAETPAAPPGPAKTALWRPGQRQVTP